MFSTLVRSECRIALYVAAIIGLFELFRYPAWGQGITRALMLAVLAGLMWCVWQGRRRVDVSGRAARGIRMTLTAIVCVAVCSCFWSASARIRLTTGGSEILLDQGQHSYRALRLLERGLNPYGRGTMIDPVEYGMARARIMTNSGCLASPSGDYHAEMNHYWRTLDVARAADRLFFVLRKDPACQRWTTTIESLGFKYGPVLLASYWPFVRVWDKAGIYVNHLVCFILFVSWLLVVCWQRYDRRAGLFLLPLVVFLVPRHVRHYVLNYSASDLLPTAMAVMAAWCCLEKRFTAGAILLALSIGAKPLPGALYLPLLTAARPRHWVWLAGVGLAVYAPVFAWDFRGGVNNLVLFNLLRDTDHTALLHFLPAVLQAALPVVSFVGIAALARHGHRSGWDSAAVFEYLIGAHLLLLFSGKIFHNNYLVWLLPLIGLALAEATSGPLESSVQNGLSPMFLAGRMATRVTCEGGR